MLFNKVDKQSEVLEAKAPSDKELVYLLKIAR